MKKVYKLGRDFINIDFVKTMTKPTKQKIEGNEDCEYIYFTINNETYYEKNFYEHNIWVIEETSSPIHKWQKYFHERLEKTTYELKEDIKLQEYNDFCEEAEVLFKVFIER